jgi:flagellar basal body-associated protein FliL
MSKTMKEFDPEGYARAAALSDEDLSKEFVETMKTFVTNLENKDDPAKVAVECGLRLGNAQEAILDRLKELRSKIDRLERRTPNE